MSLVGFASLPALLLSLPVCSSPELGDHVGSLLQRRIALEIRHFLCGPGGDGYLFVAVRRAVGIDDLLIWIPVERHPRAACYLRTVFAAQSAENHSADGDGTDDAEGPVEFPKVHARKTAMQEAARSWHRQRDAADAWQPG